METKTNPVTEKGLAVARFEDFKSMDEMLSFGNVIAKSQLSPLKKGEDVVAALLYGKELGFGVMASINNIYPINGKCTLGIHLILGLLLKNGITYEIIRDYEPVFDLYLKASGKNPDGSVKEIMIPLKEQFYDEAFDESKGEVRNKAVKGYKTVIKFTRKVKQSDGSYITMTALGAYSTYDAVVAGFIGGDKPKDNWLKHPKQMVFARAGAIGGRKIADDLLNGIYETSEIQDTYSSIAEDAKNVEITSIKNPESIKKTETSSNSTIEEATVVE